MVHEKIPEHGGPMYKTLKPAILFPVVQEFPFRPAGGRHRLGDLPDAVWQVGEPSQPGRHRSLLDRRP